MKACSSKPRFGHRTVHAGEIGLVRLVPFTKFDINRTLEAGEQLSDTNRKSETEKWAEEKEGGKFRWTLKSR